MVIEDGVKTERIIPISLIEFSNLITPSFIGPEIDPRRESFIRLQLKNNYNIRLEDVNIKLSGDIFEDITRTINLEEFEAKVEEFKVNLNPNTKEGKHSITITLSTPEKLISETKKDITISYYPGLREIITPESSFLVIKETIKKVNDGNAVINEIYVKQFSGLQKLVTSTDPLPNSISYENGVYLYKWNLNLNPGEEKTIIVEINYRYPLISLIVIIIILGIIYYYFIHKDIEVKKKVLTTIKTEKGITKLRVSVSVRNKSGRELKNVKIMESIPSIAKNPSEFGTLTPNRIVKLGNRLNLIWIIDIGKHEERLLSYKVESGLEAIGKLVIPPTAVKYHKAGRSIVAKSNRIVLLSK